MHLVEGLKYIGSWLHCSRNTEAPVNLATTLTQNAHPNGECWNPIPPPGIRRRDRSCNACRRRDLCHARAAAARLAHRLRKVLAPAVEMTTWVGRRVWCRGNYMQIVRPDPSRRSAGCPDIGLKPLFRQSRLIPSRSDCVSRVDLCANSAHLDSCSAWPTWLRPGCWSAANMCALLPASASCHAAPLTA